MGFYPRRNTSLLRPCANHSKSTSCKWPHFKCTLLRNYLWPERSKLSWRGRTLTPLWMSLTPHPFSRKKLFQTFVCPICAQFLILHTPCTAKADIAESYTWNFHTDGQEQSSAYSLRSHVHPHRARWASLRQSEFPPVSSRARYGRPLTACIPWVTQSCRCRWCGRQWSP